jgi:hypothetical protein
VSVLKTRRGQFDMPESLMSEAAKGDLRALAQWRAVTKDLLVYSATHRWSEPFLRYYGLNPAFDEVESEYEAPEYEFELTETIDPLLAELRYSVCWKLKEGGAS